MQSEFRKIGDWNAVRLITTNFKKEMQTAGEISCKRFGLYAEKLAKEHMSRQDLNWDPLEAQYLKRKKKQGFSENILMRSTTYFQSITSWTEGLKAFAGVKRYAKDEDGNDLGNIALYLEYGSESRGYPARPLWGPVFKESLEWNYKNNLAPKIFLERMRSKYLIGK